MFGFGTSRSDSIVNPQRFTDWVFLLGWLGALGGFLTVGFMNLKLDSSNTPSYTSKQPNNEISAIFTQSSLYINIGLALFVGYLMATLFLQLLKSHAEAIVKGIVYGGWLLLIGLSLAFYGLGSAFYNSSQDVDKAIGLIAVVCAGVSASMALYALLTAMLACCCWRHSLRVTAALLQCAAQVFSDKLCGALSLSFFSTFISLIFLYAWLLATYGWCQMFGYDPDGSNRYATERQRQDQQDSSPPLAALAISMFVFFWTNGVLSNTVHVAYCKMVGCWYYMTETEYREKCAPIRFYLHAWTYHIGSICFGSLIIAIISTLRWIVQWLEDENRISGHESNENKVFMAVKAVILTVIRIILSLVEEIADFINKIAYVSVGVRNEPFVESAKTTYKLFGNVEGLKLVMQNSLTNVVLRHVTCFFLFGILLACWVIMKVSLLSSAVTLGTQPILFGFLLTAVAAGCVVGDTMNMLNSGVLAIFVLYAEDSSKLRSVSHYLWGELESRRTICASQRGGGGFFNYA